MEYNEYEFVFSLQVLNHLGRGLYRNFATVVAEAVSNAWDADATEVYIDIYKSKKEMTIRDNGKGMDSKDFQHKFLNIGYSRREHDINPNRKVLGRKGIGKLALLSIADRVIVNSMKEDCEEAGGIIDNGALNEAIADENEKGVDQKKYTVKSPEKSVFKEGEQGTCITFEGIKETINNPEMIKKYLAIIFNFAVNKPDGSEEKFEMHIGDGESYDKIDKECLSEFYQNTQYLWSIGKLKDEVPSPLLEIDFKNEDELEEHQRKTGKIKRILKQKEFEVQEDKENGIKYGKYAIRGYIASVSKPSQLAIRGSGEESGFRAKLNLFVNGRLRHEDVLNDLPTGQTSQYPSNYIYGEIHVDSFDDVNDNEEKDMFTSNRENVIKDDARYKEFLNALKEINREVLDDWSEWRKKTDPIISIPEDNLKRMRPEIKEIIDYLLKLDPADEDFIEKLNKGILRFFLGAPSGKRILICHSSEDKILADKVEQELLKKGVSHEKILYTSSDEDIAKIPAGEDIFEYIRKFFIQHLYEKPIVIFVLSYKMRESWAPCLEAGAAWVISEANVDQALTIADGYNEKLDPLNSKRLYLNFDANGNFVDKNNDVDRVFKYIAGKVKN